MAEQPNEATPPEEWDLNATELILNGHHVAGSGDAHEKLKLILPAGHRRRMGAEAHVQADGTGDVGGQLIVTLKGTTPSYDMMRNWMLQGMAANSPTYSGTLKRPDGSQLVLRYGRLMGAPGPPDDWVRTGYGAYLFFFMEIT